MSEAEDIVYNTSIVALRRSGMTIKQKLLVLSAGLLVLMALMGTLALQGLEKTNAAFATTYHDRVMPLSQLKIVADQYAVDIVDTTHKANHQTISPDEALKHIGAAQAKIQQQWQSYSATEMTGDETELVKKPSARCRRRIVKSIGWSRF
ncbi:MCP four helix bundle domain-containing protein [Chitinibacter tainanensis]|uniref:MCP four helix bundle domain-containing protein n=2 Tax=Chitinibacter TaxID=230666 RepID=UPI002355A399|nr:MCP four helix bundle domain-containing protein [Chitinibacter tainanensis]